MAGVVGDVGERGWRSVVGGVVGGVGERGWRSVVGGVVGDVVSGMAERG